MLFCPPFCAVVLAGSASCHRSEAARAASIRLPTPPIPPTHWLQPAGALVGKCRTLDQAKAVVTFLDAASGEELA